MSGNKFDSEFSGTDGHDEYKGSNGRDKILGGKGDDTLSGGNGDDRIDGDGISKDLCDNKSEYSLEEITWGTPSDHDILSGGKGDDVINGHAGHDELNGDEGDDTLSGGSDHDELNGGTGDDQLFGGSGNDTLSGGKGNDILDGGIGNDHLTGGPGNDILNGGGGINTYYFDDRWGRDIVGPDGDGKIVFTTTASPETFTFKRINYDLLITQGTPTSCNKANKTAHVNKVNSIRLHCFFHPALKDSYSFSYKGQSYSLDTTGNKCQLLATGD